MNLLFMQNGLAPYGIPHNGLVALYDPYRDLYGRNIITKEPTSLTDTPVNSNVAWNNGVVFGDNSVIRYAYLNQVSSSIGVKYLMAIDVKMDDNSIPQVGSGNDFSVIIANNSSSIISITHIGNSIYRIVAYNVAMAANTNFGVLKPTTSSAKGFTIIGNWQINLGTLYPYAPPSGLPQSLIDYTGRGNNAQLGSAAGADTNDPAWSGNGLVFGTDDYCKSSSPAFDDLAQFTCITVFNPASAGGGGYGRILEKGGGRVFRFNPDASLVYDQLFQTGVAKTWTSGAITISTPTILALRFNGAPTLYNGKTQLTLTETGTGTGAIGADASRDLYIGNNSTTTRNLDGTIYCQLWYNRVLSDAEYMQAYNGLRRLMSARGITI